VTSSNSGSPAHSGWSPTNNCTTAWNRCARAACEAASQALREEQAKLDALQPERLNADLDRINRAIKTNEDARREAEQRQTEARVRLESEGREDPHELLAFTQARLNAARDAQAREQLIADSIQLLANAFREERKALADRFSQPLADKITAYLRCLFGNAARAKVTLHNNKLHGIEFLRGDHQGAFDFSSLSGGTREQVAAAVRLAIAEILASSHGGSLPVVFDDAFANSDPHRVLELQRMLDHAATQNLQVIILSCNPSDYTTLGAAEVGL